MADYKIYPPIPSALPEAPPQVGYHLSVIKAKSRGLIDKEEIFEKKYKKYKKKLNLLTWLNACSSGISIATGISSVATFATFIRIPVSTALGAASMTGTIASGIISVLTKKYQQKLKKVMCLIDIVTPALVVFKRVVSATLKNGVIDEEEGIDWCQSQDGSRAQILSGEKPIGRDTRAKEKSRNKSLIACSLCYFVCYLKNG